jgi:undecaprenyl-diphosphatase
MTFTYSQAIITAIIQGITELFPVSSLGHAILIPAWIGGSFKEFISEENHSYLLITIAMHLASVIALFIVFRNRWFKIVSKSLKSLRVRDLRNAQFQVLTYIVIATIPVGFLGVLFSDFFQTLFGKPLYTGAFLMLNGLILFSAERLVRKNSNEAVIDSDESIATHLNGKSALLIGIGQSAALFAGVSRFGITMSAGLLRKLNHSTASDFAFLLSLPVILGASIVKLPELFTAEARDLLGPILVGCLVSGICTYISVRFLVNWFKTRTLYPFAIYCFVLGLASVVRFS